MAVGLTSRRLRAPYYERVASGIWRSLRPSAASARPDARAELIQLARAQREAMPGHAISHQSAAVPWGLPPALRSLELLERDLSELAGTRGRRAVLRALERARRGGASTPSPRRGCA